MINVNDVLRSSDAAPHPAVRRALPRLWMPHLDCWRHVLHAVGRYAEAEAPGHSPLSPRLLVGVRTFSALRSVNDRGMTLHLWVTRVRNDHIGHGGLADRAHHEALLPGLLRDLAAAASAADRRAGRPVVRVVASVRSEWLDVVAARAARHGAPGDPSGRLFFASVDDLTGRPAPWLDLRPFVDDEAETAWLRAAADTPGGGCLSAWSELAPETRRTLCQPMAIRIFHEIHAGQSGARVCSSAELWRAWALRVLGDTDAPGSLLGTARALAEACITSGAEDPPDATIEQIRHAWDRDAAPALADPVERLAGAGVLRLRPSGGYGWAHDAIAEAVMAFTRPSAPEGEGGGGRLGQVAAAARAAHAEVGGDDGALVSLLDGPAPERVLGAALLHIAPLVGHGARAPGLRRLEQCVGRLVTRALEAGPARARLLSSVLLTEVAGPLSDRVGGLPAAVVATEAVVSLSRALVAEDAERVPDLIESLSIHGSLLAALDPAAALATMEETHRRAQEHLVAAPEDPARSKIAAVAANQLSLPLRNTEPERSVRLLEQDLDLTRALVARHDRPADRLSLASTLLSLSDVVEHQDPDLAIARCEEALELAQGCFLEEPADTDIMFTLCRAYGQMASLWSQRDRERAIGWQLRDLSLSELLLRLLPHDREAREKTGMALVALTDLTWMTDADEAREHLERAIEIREELLRSEPRNPDYLRSLAGALNRLGSLLDESDPVTARGLLERDLSLTRRLGALEPGNLLWQEDLAISLTDLAQVVPGEEARAALLREALEVRRAIRTRSDPCDVMALRGVALSWAAIADGASDPGIASEAWEEAWRAAAVCGRPHTPLWEKDILSWWLDAALGAGPGERDRWYERLEGWFDAALATAAALRPFARDVLGVVTDQWAALADSAAPRRTVRIVERTVALMRAMGVRFGQWTEGWLAAARLRTAAAVAAARCGDAPARRRHLRAAKRWLGREDAGPGDERAAELHRLLRGG